MYIASPSLTVKIGCRAGLTYEIDPASTETKTQFVEARGNPGTGTCSSTYGRYSESKCETLCKPKVWYSNTWVDAEGWPGSGQGCN